MCHMSTIPSQLPYNRTHFSQLPLSHLVKERVLFVGRLELKPYEVVLSWEDTFENPTMLRVDATQARCDTWVILTS